VALRRLLWALFAILVGTATTGLIAQDAQATNAYIYDVPAIARAGVHDFGTSEAGPTQLTGVRERSALRPGGGRGACTTPSPLSVATEAVPNGEFSISNWDGYPAGAPKPGGPFRLVEGAEYDAARKAANNANSALHRADPSLKGLDIHEIQPVKFGGSPTDIANKVALSRTEHAKLTTWWNRMQRGIR
jgi:hypothetical protein